MALCSLVLFVAGVFATMEANFLAYPDEEFNSSTSGAVLMGGVGIGLILAIGGIPLSIFLCRRIRSLV